MSTRVAKTPIIIGVVVLILIIGGTLALWGSGSDPARQPQAVPPTPGQAQQAHAAEKVTLRNAADDVEVTVRHGDTDWEGRLRVRLSAGPRSSVRVATVAHPSGKLSLSRPGGRVWACEGASATSPRSGEQTELRIPRDCFGSQVPMTAEVRIARKGFKPSLARTGDPAQKKKPNVLYMMVDDMRADDLAYMPKTRKWLGDQGVTFANSFASYPLCCPSRATMLSGQYAHNHKVYSHEDPYGFTSFDDKQTLATALKKAGYRTRYLGKYLNQYGKQPPPGKKKGTSTQYVPPGWTDWYASIDGGLPAGHPSEGGTYRYFSTTLNKNGNGYISLKGQYQTAAYGRLMSQWVRKDSRSPRPFFSYLSFTAPHHGLPAEPDDPEPAKDTRGRKTSFDTPARAPWTKGMFDDVITEAPGADWDSSYMKTRPKDLRRIRPTPAEKKAMLTVTRQRAESLASVDLSIDQVMRSLEQSGELNDTLVVFTSDNGYFLGEQLIRQGKILPYDPSLRVPLLMRGPGIPVGVKRSDPFLNTDMAPTIAEFTGARLLRRPDGVSQLKLAREGDKGWKRAILTETGPGWVVRDTDEAGLPLLPRQWRKMDQRYLLGIRTENFLYTQRPLGQEELFDMRVDPEQTRNVANQKKYVNVLNDLREALNVQRACRGDECQAPLPKSLR